MPSSRKVNDGSGTASAANTVAVLEFCCPAWMLRANFVDATKCPAIFCTWTFALREPPAFETVPISKPRWPAAPPVRATPSGALEKLNEMAPSLCDFIERAVLWVCLLAPLLCAHPPVMREESNSNSSTKRSPISHLLVSYLKNTLVRGGYVVNGVADVCSAGSRERNSNRYREIAVGAIGSGAGHSSLCSAGNGNTAYRPGVRSIGCT